MNSLKIIVLAATLALAQVPAHKNSLRIWSPAFKAGQDIPQRYSCDGKNVSPELKWLGVSAKTRSLALTVDDPDAPNGDWTHWMLYGISPQTRQIPSLSSRRSKIFLGVGPKAKQGTNSFGKLGYGGPCPPPGPAHRYFFRLYALDVEPKLGPGASRDDLLAAISGHILAQAEFFGFYRKQ